ncbi:MAG: tetratricopeptide repeat protein [Leptospiraceae bacterium]|nr:tetratricopeptide repeat protein [Leptospiraceae bacterium]MCB1201376.1 tetratricopeptide repeat protein [Leptospiraceae bacterium]
MITPELQSVLEQYNQGLSLYKKRQFQEAKMFFEKALEIIPDDGPSKLYLERCEHFIEEPPPEDWDGVFVMKTK